MNTNFVVPKIYILLLNYCGWGDTVECLESVLRLDYPNYQVILVDNDSPDHSMEKIRLWARGKLDAPECRVPSVKSSLIRPLPKPLSFVEYDRVSAEAGGQSEIENISDGVGSGQKPLILIDSGGNLGFAGGNNVALRYMMKKNDYEYVWLLNNDTVVDRSALTELVTRMKEKPSAGMCGSSLLNYDTPEIIQTRGGVHHNQWLALSKNIDVSKTFNTPFNHEEVERRMSYVCGSSMLVSRAFLESIGLMNEEYFLYFEEFDWAVRAEGKFTLAYAPKSIVYHKEGASIGSSFNGNRKSKMADYYGQKNRIVFTRKYFPHALPTVYLSFVPVILNRIRRRQWDRVKMILQIMTGTRVSEYEKR